MAVPRHLQINGREIDNRFDETDLLYRGFPLENFDNTQATIRTETIKFPDWSCNWNRYSFPEDIKYRENGSATDGCFSFSVATSRYENWATPVHDPVDVQEYPNYSHVEVRATRETDSSGIIPGKGRKLKRSKKFEYRENLVNNLNIEFMAKA